MMRTPDELAEAVADWYAARLPGLLETVRAERGLSVYDLPDPITYASYPIDISEAAIEHYPLIMVIPSTTPRMLRTEQDALHGDRYSIAYDVELWAYARGSDRKLTNQARFVYMTALRQFALADPVINEWAMFATDPRGLPGDPAVGWAESYSDIGVLPNGSTIAGARAETRIRTVDRVPPSPDPFADITQVLVDVERMDDTGNVPPPWQHPGNG